MAIIQLSGLQNDYGSYRGNTLTGRSGSVGNVPNNGLGGILGRNLPHLSGLIINIDGIGYTDSSYLNGLKASGNPYLSKNTLPTIEVTLGGLNTEFAKEYAWDEPDLQTAVDIFPERKVERLDYAEAVVAVKLNTVDDYLNYFNDFFDPTRTEILRPSKLTPENASTPQPGIGRWITNPTQYFVEEDDEGRYPGMQFLPFGAAAESPTQPTVPDPEPDPEPVVVTVEAPAEIEVAIDVQDLTPFMGVVDTIPIIIDSNPFTGASTGGFENFLLNDSVEFTRNELSQEGGLARTGLQDAYDTGDYGPMAEMVFNNFGGSYGGDGSAGSNTGGNGITYNAL